MGASPQSDERAVIELGKKIVAELGIENSVDTLGRWMSHYVASLIRLAETCTPRDIPARTEQCAKAILDLWEHRHHWPQGKRPFEGFDQIFRVLKSLDPDEAPRYFDAILVKAEDDGTDSAAARWLSYANDVDSSARLLIRSCLARAAETASDHTRTWVSLAEAAGMEHDADLAIIRILNEEKDLLTGTDLDDQVKAIQDRIDRLERLQARIASLTSDLKKQLE